MSYSIIRTPFSLICYSFSAGASSPPPTHRLGGVPRLRRIPSWWFPTNTQCSLFLRRGPLLSPQSISSSLHSTWWFTLVPSSTYIWEPLLIFYVILFALDPFLGGCLLEVFEFVVVAGVDNHQGKEYGREEEDIGELWCMRLFRYCVLELDLRTQVIFFVDGDFFRSWGFLGIGFTVALSVDLKHCLFINNINWKNLSNGLIKHKRNPCLHAGRQTLPHQAHHPLQTTNLQFPSPNRSFSPLSIYLHPTQTTQLLRTILNHSPWCQIAFTQNQIK